MIAALVSQSRGQAFWFDGETLWMLETNLGSGYAAKQIEREHLQRLIATIDDAEWLKVRDIRALSRELASRRDKERLLTVTLLLIDASRSEHVRRLAAEEWVSSFNERVWGWVESVLLSTPAPEGTDFEGAASLVGGRGDRLRGISRAQPHVQAVIAEWDVHARQAKMEDPVRERAKAVRDGWFRQRVWQRVRDQRKPEVRQEQGNASKPKVVKGRPADERPLKERRGVESTRGRPREQRMPGLPQLEEVLRGYVIAQRIRADDHGSVYEARSAAGGPSYLVKVLYPHFSSAQHSDLTAAYLMRRPLHPNVVRVVGVVEVHSSIGIISELLTARSLEEVLGTGLTDSRIVEVIDGILAGLDCAHSLGIVHARLRPSSILFADDGTPKIDDFGMGHLHDRLSSGVFSSEPRFHSDYDAPETMDWLRLRGPTPSADIWSLGCMLYEMISGKRGFSSDRHHRRRFLDLRQEGVLPPGVPQPFAAAIYGSLRYDPLERIPDCRTFREVLSGQRKWR